MKVKKGSLININSCCSVLLFGGVDGERFVSIASALNLSRAYDFELYIFLDKNYGYHFVSKEVLQKQFIDFKTEFEFEIEGGGGSDLGSLVVGLPRDAIFFIALHGMFGEDGGIQVKLEELGFVYTGSSSRSCMLAFDKYSSKKTAQMNNLAVPKVVSRDCKEAECELICKPVRGGSSIGIYTYDSYASVPEAIKSDQQYMIEHKIYGREFSCGVICDDEFNVVALPPIEILTETEFNYNEKYISHKTKEIILDDDIEHVLAEGLKHNSVLMHKALGCQGYSRSDFICSNSGLVYLETNTLPGLTEQSLIIKELSAARITLNEFVRTQIRYKLVIDR